jgi:23S rRNA U2552 (ribose-2'-O)-methylase RlmE/FtsJ
VCFRRQFLVEDVQILLCISGGSFLLKMFTMYEQETVCLMFLLCSSFTSVAICKPATSKEGNSEVYVVCLEYRGRDFAEPWLEVLREHYGEKTVHMSLVI